MKRPSRQFGNRKIPQKERDVMLEVSVRRKRGTKAGARAAWDEAFRKIKSIKPEGREP